jgi:hypothetical protein
MVAKMGSRSCPRRCVSAAARPAISSDLVEILAAISITAGRNGAVSFRIVPKDQVFDVTSTRGGDIGLGEVVTL